MVVSFTLKLIRLFSVAKIILFRKYPFWQFFVQPVFVGFLIEEGDCVAAFGAERNRKVVDVEGNVAAHYLVVHFAGIVADVGHW